MSKTKVVQKTYLRVFWRVKVKRQVDTLRGAPKIEFFCHILILFRLLMEKHLH